MNTIVPSSTQNKLQACWVYELSDLTMHAGAPQWLCIFNMLELTQQSPDFEQLEF